MSTGAELIGRESELARLRGVVDPPPAQSRTLVLLGDAGIGKTVLLNEASRQASSAGVRVLPVTARESEEELAFAVLHQLLRPLLDRLAGLPARQESALRGALGMALDPAGPDRMLTGMAVLTLLSDLSKESAVLAIVDDAQWLDRCSLDALAFAAHRLGSEPVVLVLAGFGRGGS